MSRKIKPVLTGFLLLILFCLLFFTLNCSRKNSDTVKQTVPKLITTYRPATHLIMALKMHRYLVGVHNQAAELPLFSSLNPDIAKLPVVGNKAGINIESVLGLNPTLVILYPGVKGEQIAKQLSYLHIASEVIAIESIQEIQESLRRLGKQLNAEKSAETTVQEMNRILRLVDRQLSLKKTESTPSVYIASNQNFLTTHSQKMLQHEMIVRAGARDVASLEYGGWMNISVEQLIVWQPDIIVISGSALYSLDSILKDPRFQNLKAVQKKQVYQMPDPRISIWDFPGPDVVLGILWLARISYPDCFKEIEWEKEKEEYYQKVYDISYHDIVSKSSKE